MVVIENPIDQQVSEILRLDRLTTALSQALCRVKHFYIDGTGLQQDHRIFQEYENGVSHAFWPSKPVSLNQAEHLS